MLVFHVVACLNVKDGCKLLHCGLSARLCSLSVSCAVACMQILVLRTPVWFCCKNQVIVTTQMLVTACWHVLLCTSLAIVLHRNSSLLLPDLCLAHFSCLHKYWIQECQGTPMATCIQLEATKALSPPQHHDRCRHPLTLTPQHNAAAKEPIQQTHCGCLVTHPS